MTGLTGSGIQSDTLLDKEYRIDTDNGDHDLFSHYALKEHITEAMVTGIPIIALCGKVWTPSRDGSKFPVCGTCKEIYDGIPSKDNEGGE